MIIYLTLTEHTFYSPYIGQTIFRFTLLCYEPLLIYFLSSKYTFIYLTLNKPAFYLTYLDETIFRVLFVVFYDPHILKPLFLYPTHDRLALFIYTLKSWKHFLCTSVHTLRITCLFTSHLHVLVLKQVLL